ncbi:hypothetical protein ES703_96971 [subsurface metagenome]
MAYDNVEEVRWDILLLLGGLYHTPVVVEGLFEGLTVGGLIGAGLVTLEHDIEDTTRHHGV